MTIVGLVVVANGIVGFAFAVAAMTPVEFDARMTAIVRDTAFVISSPHVVEIVVVVIVAAEMLRVAVVA